MENGKITVDDIFGAGFSENMEKIATNADNLKAAIISMATEVRKNVSGMSSGLGDVKELTTSVNALSAAFQNCKRFMDEHNKAVKQASTVARSYNTLTQQEVVELTKFQKAIEDTFIDASKFKEALNSSGDSVNLLKEKIRMLEDEVKKYSLVEQQNSGIVQTHAAGLAHLKSQLDETTRALSLKTQAAKADSAATKQLSIEEQNFILLKQAMAYSIREGKAMDASDTVGDTNNYSLQQQIELLKTLDDTTKNLSATERESLSHNQAYINLRNNLNESIRASKDQLNILNDVRERANSTTGNSILIEQRLQDIKIRSKIFDAQKVESLNQIVAALHSEAASEAANSDAILQNVNAIEEEKLSYNELSALYSALKEVMNSVALEQQEENKGWSALKDKLASLYDTMNKYQQATGRFQMNVGKYRSAFDGLSYSIQQIIREAPNLAISANTFFLAISNNLPMVVDQIQNFKREQTEIKVNMARLEEAGRATSNEYKNLASQVTTFGKKLLTSIFNVQSAIVVLAFVLTKYGAKIVKWAQELINGVKAVNNEISRTVSIVNLIMDIRSKVSSTQTELGIIIDRLKKVGRDTDEWRVGVARVNELTHSNLDATTATISSIEAATKAYSKQAIQIATNESIVKRISESLNAKASYKLFKSGLKKYDENGNGYYYRNTDTMAAALGIKKYENGKLTDDWSELNKLLESVVVKKQGKKRSEETLASLTPEEARKNIYEGTDYEGTLTKGEYYKTIVEKSTKALKDAETKLDNFARARLNWMSDETEKWLEEQIKLIENPDSTTSSSRSRSKQPPALRDVDLMYEEAMEARANLAGELYDKQIKLQEEKFQLEANNLREKLAQETEDIETNLKNGLVSQATANEQKAKLEENYQLVRQSLIAKYNYAIEELNKKHYERVNKDYLSSLSDQIKEVNAKAKADAKAALNGVQSTAKTPEDEDRRNNAIRAQISVYYKAFRELAAKQDLIDDELSKRAEEAVSVLNVELRELNIEYAKLQSGDFKGSEADRQNALADIEARIKQIPDDITAVRNGVLSAAAEAKEEINAAIDENVQHANDALKKIDYSQRLNTSNYTLGAQIKKKLSTKKNGLMGMLFTDQEIDEMNKNGTFEEMWDKAFENTLSAVNTWKDQMVSSINEVIQSYIELMQAKLEAAQENTEEAKEEYEKEKAYLEAGYASRVETAWAEYQEKKEMEQQAQEDYARAQQAQEAVDTATQVSSLLTATAQIWAASTKAGGLLSPAIAKALIATMWASFVGAKAYAASVTSKTAQYGEGHVELIGGGSHASGNDSPLAYDKQGRERRVEGGEMFAVFSRRAVSRYGQSNIADLVNSYNNGTLSSLPNATFFSSATSAVDLSNIENYLDDIKTSRRRRSYYNPQGLRVVEGRNSRVTYIKR